ncbi:UNVERIFIED_CONTAM: hypothetical protein Sradi_3573300 [Sesamum radiatum]|uniref:UspA domain-containing protein n=1 Tax=Sesamum radiatum TaxID=300843 RepID=A0AAW2QG56_SESRA
MVGVNEAARKVMVVADPSRESAGALDYALSHALVENDTLVLLHVETPNPWKNPFGALFKNPMSPGSTRGSSGGSQSWSFAAAEGGGGAEVDFLDGMKRTCMAKQPKVKVVAEKVEMTDGKDKASVIIAHSAASKVDLLIIGQRKTLSNALLGDATGRN